MRSLVVKGGGWQRRRRGTFTTAVTLVAGAIAWQATLPAKALSAPDWLKPILPARFAGAPKEKQLVIPDLPSAQEQYAFATMYAEGQVRASAKDRRLQQAERKIECYSRVVTLYPSDTTYTPVARLQIGDIRRGVEQYDQAEKAYRDAIADYPTNDYVHARALYSIGRTLDQRQKFEEAKAIYREVGDKFRDSQLGTVREIVAMAERNYLQVHSTQTPTPKKKKP